MTVQATIPTPSHLPPHYTSWSLSYYLYATAATSREVSRHFAHLKGADWMVLRDEEIDAFGSGIKCVRQGILYNLASASPGTEGIGTAERGYEAAGGGTKGARDKTAKIYRKSNKVLYDLGTSADIIGEDFIAATL
ncbi:hypothetical protein VE00_09633 [Pseudogymnoascus sp. WSF 3629]|nr:hypothetical protein VE00_09633 [Pseudogymnoascus sp. WSF 3629]